MRKFRARDIHWLSCSCSILWGVCSYWENYLPAKTLWKVRSSVPSRHLYINKTYHLLNTSNALGQDGFTVAQVPHSEGPCSWFHALLCHLEFLSSSEQGAPCFHFTLDPTDYVADLGSWCLCLVSFKTHNHLQGVAVIPIAQSKALRLSEFPEDPMCYKGKSSQEMLA